MITFRGQALTWESPFADIAQYAIETYYRKPYAKTQAPRLLHGGVHVARTAMLIDILLFIYKAYEKYWPGELLNPNGEKIAEIEIKIIKLAAIYHDVANDAESFHDEEKHAEIFIQDMHKLGFDKEKVTWAADGIRFKDSQSGVRTIYQKLLHDSDSLEFLRIPGMSVEKFHLYHLDISKKLTSINSQLIMHLIKCHYQMICYFEEFHQACELADNCYQATIGAVRAVFFNSIITAHNISLQGDSTISLEHLYFPWLGRRYYQPLIKNKLLSLNFPPESQDNRVIKEYETNGVYIRVLLDKNSLHTFSDEYAVCENNKKALEKYQITNSESFRKIFKENNYSIPDFYFRPATYVKKGLPIKLISNKNNAYIINKASSIVYKYYKRNAHSGFISTGEYNYERSPLTKAKGLDNFEDFSKKLEEMAKRRVGLLPDKNLCYYGEDVLPHNEVLLSYNHEDVIGLVLGESTQASQDAFRIIKNYPSLPIYYYTAKLGLVQLSRSEIISRMLLMPRSVATFPFFKIKNIKNQFNNELRICFQYKYKRLGYEYISGIRDGNLVVSDSTEKPVPVLYYEGIVQSCNELVSALKDSEYKKEIDALIPEFKLNKISYYDYSNQEKFKYKIFISLWNDSVTRQNMPRYLQKSINFLHQFLKLKSTHYRLQYSCKEKPTLEINLRELDGIKNIYAQLQRYYAEYKIYLLKENYPMVENDVLFCLSTAIKTLASKPKLDALLDKLMLTTRIDSMQDLVQMAFLAVEYNNIIALRLLLDDYGVDINFQDSQGKTLLHQAVKFSPDDNRELLVELLERCPEDLADKWFRNYPIHDAVLLEKKNILQELLDFDIYTDGFNYQDFNYQMLIVSKKIKSLYDCIVCIDAIDIDSQGNNCIHIAVLYHNYDFLEFYLNSYEEMIAKDVIYRNNTVFNSYNSNNRTPIMEALSLKNYESYKLLLPYVDASEQEKLKTFIAKQTDAEEISLLKPWLFSQSSRKRKLHSEQISNNELKM